MRLPHRSAPSQAPQHPAKEAQARQLASQAPQEVRLIGGRLKRTPLQVPAWPGLRPTPARVRETLFNWLGQDLSGWRVLDAFAGTGALGLEAASRGASEVVLVERERVLAQHLLKTAARLNLAGVSVQTADALSWMHRSTHSPPQGRFELVLLDPPFDQNAFGLALVAARACVVVGGWVYLEADRPFGPRPASPRKAGPSSAAQDTDSLPDVLPDGLRLHRFGQAGAVHYHLIERVE